jgi:polyphosphate kinase
LEHSRIFYFENSSGSQPHIFAGSADWMPRNFHRRIEVVFPIEDPNNRSRVKALLEIYLKDTHHARVLRANGSYHKIYRKKRNYLVSAQDFLYQQAESKRTAQAAENSDEPVIVTTTEPQ